MALQTIHFTKITLALQDDISTERETELCSPSAMEVDDARLGAEPELHPLAKVPIYMKIISI